MVYLAIDPNVFYAADFDEKDSIEFLKFVYHNRNHIKIAIDKPHKAILKAYIELSGELGGRGLEWLKWIITNKLEQTIDFSANEVELKRNIFVSCNCNTPVEPELIVISGQGGSKVKMIVVDPIHEDLLDSGVLAHRGIYDGKRPSQIKIPEPVKVAFPNLSVLPVQSAHRQIQARLDQLPYPSDEEELKIFLRDCDYTEGDQVEFKQPHNNHPNPGNQLTSSIIHDAMKAVCAFANSHGGTVLIGITERNNQGIIHGFTPNYVNTTDPLKEGNPPRFMNLDILDQTINTFLSEMEPRLAPRYARLNIFPLRSNRNKMVAVLKVNKFDGESEVMYKGKTWYRTGTTTWYP